MKEPISGRDVPEEAATDERAVRIVSHVITREKECSRLSARRKQASEALCPHFGSLLGWCDLYSHNNVLPTVLRIQDPGRFL